MVDDMNKFVAEQANKTADVMSQLGRKGTDFSTLPAFNRDIIEIGNHRIIESQQNIAGNNLIWGNNSFGIWGSYYWGNGAESSFVLGHNIAGVLGTSLLGDNNSSFETVSVYNDNNWFPEGFWNDRFIDTSSSSGSYIESSEYYELNYGEEFYSNRIAFENKIYKSVLVTLSSEYSNGSYIGSDANDDIGFYISNNNGSDWQEISNYNITQNLSGGDTSGLKVKIISNGGDTGKLTMPLTVPFNFTSATINIKEFTVKYNT